MNKLDVFVRAISQATGLDPVSLRAQIETRFRGERTMLDEMPDLEAQALLQKLTHAAANIRQWSAIHPEEADDWLKQLGVNPVRVERERSAFASYMLREKIRQGNIAAPRPRKPMTRETFQQIGMVWWSHAFEHLEDTSDLASALQGMWTHVQEARASGVDPRWCDNMELILRTERGVRLLLFCARLAHYAFPVVQYGSHKYAAALMATAAPKDVPIKAPWPTFLIELPTGLLHTTNENEVPESIAYVLVNQHPVMRAGTRREGWSLEAFTSSGTTLYRDDLLLDDLRGTSVDAVPTNKAEYDAFGATLDSRDDRTLMLISRLVLSTCLAMSNPDDVRKVGTHPRSESVGPLRNAKDPSCRVFRVGKAITLDCRQAIADYVDGKTRGPVTVQFLVRGHWRWQACGTGMRDHRWTWIEPYWKGSTDAPINLREHTLKAPEAPPDAR